MGTISKKAVVKKPVASKQAVKKVVVKKAVSKPSEPKIKTWDKQLASLKSHVPSLTAQDLNYKEHQKTEMLIALNRKLGTSIARLAEIMAE